MSEPSLDDRFGIFWVNCDASADLSIQKKAEPPEPIQEAEDEEIEVYNVEIPEYPYDWLLNKLAPDIMDGDITNKTRISSTADSSASKFDDEISSLFSEESFKDFFDEDISSLSVSPSLELENNGRHRLRFSLEEDPELLPSRGVPTLDANGLREDSVVRRGGFLGLPRDSKYVDTRSIDNPFISQPPQSQPPPSSQHRTADTARHPTSSHARSRSEALLSSSNEVANTAHSTDFVTPRFSTASSYQQKATHAAHVGERGVNFIFQGRRRRFSTTFVNPLAAPKETLAFKPEGLHTHLLSTPLNFRRADSHQNPFCDLQVIGSPHVGGERLLNVGRNDGNLPLSALKARKATPSGVGGVEGKRAFEGSVPRGSFYSTDYPMLYTHTSAISRYNADVFAGTAGSVEHRYSTLKPTNDAPSFIPAAPLIDVAPVSPPTQSYFDSTKEVSSSSLKLPLRQGKDVDTENAEISASVEENAMHQGFVTESFFPSEQSLGVYLHPLYSSAEAIPPDGSFSGGRVDEHPSVSDEARPLSVAKSPFHYIMQQMENDNNSIAGSAACVENGVDESRHAEPSANGPAITPQQPPSSDESSTLRPSQYDPRIVDILIDYYRNRLNRELTISDPQFHQIYQEGKDLFEIFLRAKESIDLPTSSIGSNAFQVNALSNILNSKKTIRDSQDTEASIGGAAAASDSPHSASLAASANDEAGRRGKQLQKNTLDAEERGVENGAAPIIGGFVDGVQPRQGRKQMWGQRSADVAGGGAGMSASAGNRKSKSGQVGVAQTDTTSSSSRDLQGASSSAESSKDRQVPLSEAGEKDGIVEERLRTPRAENGRNASNEEILSALELPALENDEDADLPPSPGSFHLDEGDPEDSNDLNTLGLRINTEEILRTPPAGELSTPRMHMALQKARIIEKAAVSSVSHAVQTDPHPEEESKALALRDSLPASRKKIGRRFVGFRSNKKIKTEMMTAHVELSPIHQGSRRYPKRNRCPPLKWYIGEHQEYQMNPELGVAEVVAVRMCTNADEVLKHLIGDYKPKHRAHMVGGKKMRKYPLSTLRIDENSMKSNSEGRLNEKLSNLPIELSDAFSARMRPFFTDSINRLRNCSQLRNADGTFFRYRSVYAGEDLEWFFVESGAGQKAKIRVACGARTSQIKACNIKVPPGNYKDTDNTGDHIFYGYVIFAEDLFLRLIDKDISVKTGDSFVIPQFTEWSLKNASRKGPDAEIWFNLVKV